GKDNRYSFFAIRQPRSRVRLTMGEGRGRKGRAGMARISGVDLPPNKRMFVGLTSIYGIGQPRARSICARSRVDVMKKVKDLTDEEITPLRRAIEAARGVEAARGTG